MVNISFAQLETGLRGLAVPDLSGTDGVALIVLLMFVLLFGWERFAASGPEAKRVTGHSYLTNLAMMLMNDVLLSLMGIGSLSLLATHYASFGLLNGVTDPWARGLISFVVLDLVLYGWHVASHRYVSLWRFHRVHHSDLSMNASTAFRLHIVELILTTLVKGTTIVALGIETTIYLLCEAIMTGFVMFHHANVSFPGEKLIGQVFVVPRLHRAHHSQQRQEHDNNYGAVFALWDRWFGTLTEAEPAAIGLQDVGEQSLWQTVKFAFEPLMPPKMVPARVSLPAMIAEAAYYRALKRGFQPGHEVSDWLQAERDILVRSGISKRYNLGTRNSR